ncbi:hypothetical protein ABL78_2346 [Leptomonas seymouri]|uniref:Uncharacterized protein n=1 Tax=Leptomonas seymouri TaxID=5684 RepID=A0A0N1I666_LEPSE|nr:hypothetical protein ABL78_2346 [Leptomonas seymouri]|eukprot:KPI88534.1 hypothetical protein ABL78_2346 [Leptomonas seymouri]
MSTVQELQAQLDALRTQHAKEVQAARATLTRLQEDLTNIQVDTDALEKEEAELYNQFVRSKSPAAEPEQNPFKGVIVQSFFSLIDCDEGKCRST